MEAARTRAPFFVGARPRRGVSGGLFRLPVARGRVGGELVTRFTRRSCAWRGGSPTRASRESVARFGQAANTQLLRPGRDAGVRWCDRARSASGDGLVTELRRSSPLRFHAREHGMATKAGVDRTYTRPGQCRSMRTGQAPRPRRRLRIFADPSRSTLEGNHRSGGAFPGASPESVGQLFGCRRGRWVFGTVPTSRHNILMRRATNPAGRTPLPSTDVVRRLRHH
jgi:hypothetical protein